MKRNSSKLPACICRTALAVVLFLFLLSPSFAENITIGWDCNDEPDLEGYTVYRNIGSPGPPYNYSADIPEEDLANPLTPMVTVTGLQEEKKYYLAVTAYDTNGNESRYSNDVCVEIVDSDISICNSNTSASSAIGGGSGGGGGGCFINTADSITSEPLLRPFFMFQPAEIFFGILFLLFLAAIRSILLRIFNYINI